MESEFEVTHHQPFWAQFLLGLNSGYSSNTISKTVVIKELTKYQKKLAKLKGVYLSVSVSESTIILNDQIEQHLTFSFINYPPFELEIDKLKTEIQEMAKHLMRVFSQNRVIINYIDSTAMIQKSTKVDPRVLL